MAEILVAAKKRFTYLKILIFYFYYISAFQS